MTLTVHSLLSQPAQAQNKAILSLYMKNKHHHKLLSPHGKTRVHYNKKCLLQKKNCCNNIEVIAIVYAKCCNKIWGNKFVLQRNFVAINLKYFNENFDIIIYLLLQ